MRRPLIALLVACVAPGLLARTAEAAKPKQPCAAKSRSLARDGAVRVVRADDTQFTNVSYVYVCAPRYPRGRYVGQVSFTEPCGSNSSRTVYAEAAAAGRFALVALNVSNDNCREDDGFQVLRYDVARGSRQVISSAKGINATNLQVNAAGTAVWSPADRLVLAVRGKAPQLLLAGGAGTGSEPVATKIGRGALPLLTVKQGKATFRLDSARHLQARRRCGATTVTVTRQIAIGRSRVCWLPTGRSTAGTRCTFAHGTTVLCATRLIDPSTAKVVFEHPGLAGRHVREGDVRDDLDVTDVIPLPGRRAVVLREGSRKGPVDQNTVLYDVDQLVLLLPGGKERVLAEVDNATEKQRADDIDSVEVRGTTLRWREFDSVGFSRRRSMTLPSP